MKNWGGSDGRCGGAELVFSPSGVERERERIERGGEKPRGRGTGHHTAKDSYFSGLSL